MNSKSISKLYLGVMMGAFMAVPSVLPALAQSDASDVSPEMSEFLELPTDDILQDPAQESQPEQQEIIVNEQPNIEDIVVPQQPMQDVVSNDDPLALMNEMQNQAALSNPAPMPSNDALPNVDGTRLSVDDTGLDMSAIDGIRTPVVESDVEEISPEELAEEIRQEAFDAAITGIFPMRPDEIRELLRQYDTTTRAVQEPINGIPTPTINVTTISLDPGVKPMTLKTATGHITTLSMLDATGAPWPIQDISWAGDFEITEPEEGGHVIRITPMAVAAYGNMSIRLVELQTPVTIMLSTSKDEVQYRVDARIAEFGPQSAPQIIEGGTERVAGNALIMSLLDGTPPQGAQKLYVSGVDTRTSAYKINNMTYVRTPLTLLSPGWQQSVSSADGMNVYALNDTPVLLLSDRGRFTRANVSARKDPLDE